MAPIQVLPERLIDQIAAGEVVERPASVVKELVENSLDAGATRIDVGITEGGLRWICVADNGIGMSVDDARLAFQRHATSKIRSLQDLERVSSLGFRGEALPSIASVADVRMRTRRADDSVGTEVTPPCSDTSRIQVSPVACNPGTRLEVANLFARVPARRKFLKAQATEAGHITRLLERIALVRPELRLSLERDGRTALLFLPTDDLRERLAAVLPARVGDRLLPFEARTSPGSVRGFAGPTDLSRGHAGDVHLFVNGRPVRDRVLLFAVRHAYRDALPPGRHPVAVVYLELDPAAVDVNVHPSKSEVRFREPEAVRQLVSRALASVLVRPSTRTAPRVPPAGGARGEPLELALAPYVADRGPAVESRGLEGAPPPQTAHASPGVERAPHENVPALSGHRVVGQLLATYLVLEGPGELVLVDQHAAHERILFEQLRDALSRGRLARQALLLPVWLELPHSVAAALEAERATLERVGYELEWGHAGVRGGLRVGIKAVPALLGRRGESVAWIELLEETASGLGDPTGSEARDGIERALHHVLATAACHAACRKGDRLTPEEIQGLLRDLDRHVRYPNCPHGRPIAQRLSEEDLERRFLRR